MSYLERLKAKITQNQPNKEPAKPAKPAQAPFAPFVGTLGTHVSEKKEPTQGTSKTNKRVSEEGEYFPAILYLSPALSHLSLPRLWPGRPLGRCWHLAV